MSEQNEQNGQSEQNQPTEQKTFDINQVIAQARAVLTDPRGYYSTMPKTGGFANPVIFVAVMAAVLGLITGIFGLFGPGGFGGLIGAIILTPIFVVIGSFIGAAILFVIWKLMGSEENYETAYRCLSAATAIYPVVAIISFIPYLGTIVGVVWATWLMILASEMVHARNRKTATIVFGIIGALMLIMNLSAESTSRHMSQEMESSFEDYENMDSDEAGRKMGEFLKGFEESMNEGDKPSPDEQ